MVSRFLADLQIERSVKSNHILFGKMLILQTYKFLVNLIGLDAFGRNGRWTEFRAAYISLSFFACFIMVTANFMLSIYDLKKFVEISFVACGMLMTLTIYVQLLINHDRFVLLLDDFQNIVNEST